MSTTFAPTTIPAGRAARPVRVARPAPATGSVRLTRRGRLVVLLGALAIVLLLGVFWGAGSVATETPGRDATTVVRVTPGDTLFAIAAEHTTDGDVNAMVERIQDLNGLDSAVLAVGQQLRVPVTD